MKNYQKYAIFPSVLVSCMTNQLIHAEYEKTHYGIYKSLIWSCIWTLDSNGLHSVWILVALAQQHHIFMPCSCIILLHMLVFWLLAPFLLDRSCSEECSRVPVYEAVPPLLICQASKPPCSFRYNPTLSLLLSVIALGQQRFICYFVLR